MQKVDLSVKNATAFKDRLLARTGNTEAIQRVQAAQAVPLPRAAPAVQEYMEYQHCACSQVWEKCGGKCGHCGGQGAWNDEECGMSRAVQGYAEYQHCVCSQVWKSVREVWKVFGGWVE